MANDGSLQTYWYGKSSVGYHSSGANTVLLNQWSYVVATWDTSNVILYVNGVLKNSISSAGAGNAATGLNIGAESVARQFIGRIDEVRIYSRALSATEIQATYNDLK